MHALAPPSWLKVKPYPHQKAFILAPVKFPELAYFFMVAGYNAGKSFTVVEQMLIIAMWYNGAHIKVGIGGGTMTLLQKTTLADFSKWCAMSGLAYDYNKNEKVITLGTTQFVIIATTEPDLIYAHNFHIFICDELDELPQEKALVAFVAIQERTRVDLPEGKGANGMVIPARSAYSMFLTTAQGYRGTYQIVEEMKDRGDGFFIIHARSEDNLSISREWLDRMKSLYSEVEAMVFLYGLFANLSTGRVYYDYDEAKNMRKDSIIPEPADIIHIGQDLNSGYSRGTAILYREGKLHVLQSWSFGQIGWAPKIIRSAYPYNPVRWYPDATAAEIVTGYAQEFRDADIGVWMGNINPSVIDRIFFVNKLFKTERMDLGPGCNPLSMALKLRQFDDKGNPEKGKGPTAPDHYCDGFEYGVWRLVYSFSVFSDLVQATHSGRAVPKDKRVT
jgi:hypothetical protein